MTSFNTRRGLVKECFQPPFSAGNLLHLSQITAGAKCPACASQDHCPRSSFPRFADGGLKLFAYRHGQSVQAFWSVQCQQTNRAAHLELNSLKAHKTCFRAVYTANRVKLRTASLGL